MNFQAYNKLLIVDEPIRAFGAGDAILGYEFKLQYPSYRGTYLSCIEKLEVWVDGQAVPAESISFLINGKQFLISQLRELWSEYWFVLKHATLRVMSQPLNAGAHKVEVLLRHRIPYAGYNGTYLALDSRDEKVLNME